MVEDIERLHRELHRDRGRLHDQEKSLRQGDWEL
jgi:hypothetical protein